MAVVPTEERKVPGLRSIRAVGTLVFSGAYVVGGEVPAFVKPGTTKAPYDVRITGQGDHTYRWDRATNKVKVYGPTGAELLAAAYPAGVTGDVVRYDAEYPKLG